MNTEGKKTQSITKQFTKDYLFVSVLPVLALLVCVVVGALLAKVFVFDLFRQSTLELNRDSEEQLERLGQEIIQTKARGVARQIDIYLKVHPDVTVSDLQNTPPFKQIALQKVGQTGYTCLYEAGTGIMRIHPNPDLVDRQMGFLSEKLPSWWAIFKPTLSGKEVSGYYDWLEKDGTIRRKYMTMTPVATPFNGVTFMLAATTYIDEFSAPIVTMKKKVSEITEHYQRFVSREGVIIGGISALLMLMTFAGVYLLGRRSSKRYILPIEHLAMAARKIGKGEWEADEHAVLLERGDEFGDLATAFSKMQVKLKELFDSLEQRLEELNQTQEALMQSEEHFRNLFNGVPVGLYQTTPDGEILTVNPTLVRMLGYPDRESFISRSADDYWADPEERQRWKAKVESFSDVHGYEMQMRKMDGTVIWTENSSRTVRDKNGKVVYYEGSLKDISDKKKAEEALLENEKKYRELYEDSKRAEELYHSLINSSADAIVIYDMAGNVQYVSPVFTETFGWNMEELEGKRIPFLPDSETQKTMEIIRELVEKGTPCQGFETKRYTKDGQLVEVSISASRYEDHEGNPVGMLVILRDISERKKLQAQLQHAQRMESIGTLAGGIAHDFNNLMMGMQGNVSLLLLDVGKNHPHHEKLKNIEKSILSGSRLTSQLLGFARKGKYKIEPVNLNKILKASSETFGRTRKEITIQHDFEPSLATIEADRTQIEQVLFNLFINAADAMPDGGNLMFKTRNVSWRDMEGKPYQPHSGHYALLTVTDTGEGMDTKTLERIFEPFFTTKEMGRGTGLGLASAYGIIKAHGGYIDAVSQKGSGTTFQLYLPVRDRSDEHDQTHLDGIEPSVKGRGTILLVDDEEMVLDVGLKMVEYLGYEVLSARDGETAISIYRDDPDGIDLVILDMIMPELSGGVVYDRLKGINPRIKVLLSSGYSIDGQATRILEQGCNGFIQKPFNLEVLSRKIEDILEEV